MEVYRQRYTEALRRAAQTLGGCARLARFLDVAPDQLNRWLENEEPTPLSVFLATLDVIADGPYAAAKVRVAVIREAQGKARGS